MKEIITDLLKQYYRLGLTVKDTIITGRPPHQVVRMSVKRTAEAWNIQNRSGEHDDQLTHEFLEKERQRIAEILYNDWVKTGIMAWERMTKQDYSRIDNRTLLTEHRDIMNFCIKALIHLEVISLHDIMYIAPLEREGISYGYKREPEMKESREEIAVKELTKTEEDFSE